MPQESVTASKKSASGSRMAGKSSEKMPTTKIEDGVGYVMSTDEHEKNAMFYRGNTIDSAHLLNENVEAHDAREAPVVLADVAATLSPMPIGPILSGESNTRTADVVEKSGADAAQGKSQSLAKFTVTKPSQRGGNSGMNRLERLHYDERLLHDTLAKPGNRKREHQDEAFETEANGAPAKKARRPAQIHRNRYFEDGYDIDNASLEVVDSSQDMVGISSHRTANQSRGGVGLVAGGQTRMVPSDPHSCYGAHQGQGASHGRGIQGHASGPGPDPSGANPNYYRAISPSLPRGPRDYSPHHTQTYRTGPYGLRRNGDYHNSHSGNYTSPYGPVPSHQDAHSHEDRRSSPHRAVPSYGGVNRVSRSTPTQHTQAASTNPNARAAGMPRTDHGNDEVLQRPKAVFLLCCPSCRRPF